MSEKMYPIPFDSLMNWVTSEYAQCGDVFGVHKHYHASGKSLPIFGERIETPFGPAAGPNSQLAQNIIAAYAAGARFFEVKTVQKMDGAELAACVPRPCILAADEGYNQEWSTELTFCIPLISIDKIPCLMPKLLLRTTRSADVCRQCLYFRLWETEFQPQNNIFFIRRKKLLTETRDGAIMLALKGNEC